MATHSYRERCVHCRKKPPNHLECLGTTVYGWCECPCWTGERTDPMAKPNGQHPTPS